MSRSVLEVLDRSLADLEVERTDSVVVAVSGGLDSVVLLRSLVEIGQAVVVATIDHGLRPSSRADADWVVELAGDLGLEVERRAVVVAAGNVQAEARRARYAALADIARGRGARFVATAHTATDQAETVLMAMVRGAGLRGLAGIAPRRALEDGVDLIRPILQLSRHNLEAEADSRDWSWREDSSNNTGAYQRNRLRQSVLPALRFEGGEGADQRIAASADAARAALDALRVGFEDAFDGSILALDATGEQLAIWITDAIAVVSPRTLRSRALTERVQTLLEAESGQRVESSGLVVWRERESLRFERSDAAPVLEGALEVEPLDTVPSVFGLEDAWVEVVDADRARDLEVRLWRDGDRIRPVGLDGSQLVSDLLHARGVARALRRRVPVVCVEGEVAWVVGHRLGQGVSVTNQTRRAERWTWRSDPG